MVMILRSKDGIFSLTGAAARHLVSGRYNFDLASLTSQQPVYRLEKSESPPTTRTLMRIASATGHDLETRFVKRRRRPLRSIQPTKTA
jgi:transcriptional regulator with XRE-family HTH domain